MFNSNQLDAQLGRITVDALDPIIRGFIAERDRLKKDPNDKEFKKLCDGINWASEFMDVTLED